MHSVMQCKRVGDVVGVLKTKARNLRLRYSRHIELVPGRITGTGSRSHGQNTPTATDRHTGVKWYSPRPSMLELIELRA